MPTPHISAPHDAFAKVCLLPGDPLRARYVAEQFLEDARLVTAVRNMEGYTGHHGGRAVSVMGTGMGIPSASIYATELVRDYGVETLIRVGSCGAVADELGLRDLIVVTGASTDSGVNRLRFAGLDFAAVADFGVTSALVAAARERGIDVRVGTVLSSDLFYHPDPELFSLASRLGMLAVEMEAAGLFAVAAETGARAGALLTVSDIIDSEEALSPEERESSFDAMIEVALGALASP